MAKNGKTIGIDLGTTNSCISVIEGNEPIIIVNAEGKRTTPSIIAYLDGDRKVGDPAKRQMVTNPKNTVYSVKRFIGSKYSEIKNDISKVAYDVVKRGDKIKIKVDDKEYMPQEVSAVVLQNIKKSAEDYLGTKVTSAVITVPAYFNDAQRQATKEAGEIAGLKVERIINEPTAAALAYGLEKKTNEVVLIFDLGGGTFDVSVLEVGDEVFEVLATSGDTHLGGDDFDQAIVDYIVTDFKIKEGIDLYKEKQALQRIIEGAEKAKIELSMLQSTRVNLPFIYIDAQTQTPKHIDIEIDRSKFEELSKELLQKCKVPIEKALEDAKLGKSEIDQVILVGGSTRIPAVRNLLSDFLGKTLNETVNPDEVVAMGASVQAGIIAGEITDLILLDVTPLSLGVETMGGLMTTIINRNASIPVKQSEVFSTGADFQDAVEIHVLQGERPFAKDNKSLGIFKLNGIPSAPKGVPKINVTFQLDVDGLLAVSAREEQSGQEQSIKIEGASVLAREEVSQMIEDAEKNASVDKSRKSLVNITYELDNLLAKADKLSNTLTSANKTSVLYFEQLIKEIKLAYLNNKLTSLSTQLLDELKYAYSILVLEFLKTQITSDSNNSNSSADGKGVVIDVTEE